MRTPSSLKGALVRETARRGASLNDVAVGHPRRLFGVHYLPTGRRSPLPGSSPVVLLRMPEELQARSRPRRPPRLQPSTTSSSARSRTSSAFPSNRTATAGALRARPQKGTPMAATNGSKNGRARSKDKVRVAIIGVGNCANSLLQGVEYYKDADPTTPSPGSCTSTSAATTSRTSSSSPRSTSSRARSASTSPTRSGRTRTTRSSSPTCRRPASRSRAA